MVSVAVFRSVLRRPAVANRSNKGITEHRWQWTPSSSHQTISCKATKADKATSGPTNASVGEIDIDGIFSILY